MKCSVPAVLFDPSSSPSQRGGKMKTPDKYKQYISPKCHIFKLEHHNLSGYLQNIWVIPLQSHNAYNALQAQGTTEMSYKWLCEKKMYSLFSHKVEWMRFLTHWHMKLCVDKILLGWSVNLILLLLMSYQLAGQHGPVLGLLRKIETWVFFLKHSIPTDFASLLFKLTCMSLKL